MTDPVIRQYVADRERLSDAMDQLRVQGFMANHQSVQAVEQALASVNQRIVQYASGISANIKELNQEYEQVHDQVQQLAAKRMKGEALKNWLGQVGKDLADVTARSDAIKVEDRAGSRLNVISTGDVPMLPYRDRRMIFAAIGGGVGALFPLARAGSVRPVASSLSLFWRHDRTTGGGHPPAGRAPHPPRTARHRCPGRHRAQHPPDARHAPGGQATRSAPGLSYDQRHARRRQDQPDRGIGTVLCGFRLAHANYRRRPDRARADQRF